MPFLLYILTIGFFIFFPSSVFAHSEVTVIEMTASGFEPNEVTIDESSSVIFVNKDKESRWPASNIHPTHDIYPEFDPRKPVEPGQSWAFKPRVGEWKYHDHLFPHMRGAITVTSEDGSNNSAPKSQNSFVVRFKEFVTNLIAKINSIFHLPVGQKQIPLPDKEEFKNLDNQAQMDSLENMIKTNGSKETWKFFKEVFAGQAGSSGNVHDLAHFAGKLIYEKDGFDGISVCTAQFAFGCYHGFLDTSFAKNLDRLLDAQAACLKLSSQGGNSIEGPAASCIQGIGHGVASFYSTSDIKKALTSCRKLTMGNEYCFDGVFMEFVRSAPISFYKKDDPTYPCNELEKDFGYAYSFSCGRNQPSLLMSRFSMGFDEVTAICASSASNPFKEACFDALGFSLAATGNVGQIVDGCKKIRVDDYISKCLKAAAGELVFQEVAGWQDKSKQVCNGVSLGQSECIEHIERLIKEYHREAGFNFRNLRNNEDANSYIREQLKICYDTNGPDGCYKQVADVLYGQFGLAKTLAVFKKNEDYPEVYARCHEVTHYLSRAEFKNQGSIAKVYAQCDSTCHGGCYHGTLEAYLKGKADEEGANLADQFAQVCGKSEDYQKPIEFNECLHGMGHAAMFVTEMELKESLKLCDTFSDQQHKERCYTGVFMENSSSSTSFDHASIYIRKDDPFYPCNILAEKYQSVCWQYQSSYFSIINNQDWKKVADLCLQIPAQYQDRCFRTIGTNQVGFTSSLSTMKKDCDLMPTAHFKDVCITGVVSSLSYRFVGESEKMVDFCDLVDRQNRESCFKQIGYGVMDWDKNTEVVKNHCQKIPDPQGKDWCMSAI